MGSDYRISKCNGCAVTSSTIGATVAAIGKHSVGAYARCGYGTAAYGNRCSVLGQDTRVYAVKVVLVAGIAWPAAFADRGGGQRDIARCGNEQGALGVRRGGVCAVCIGARRGDGCRAGPCLLLWYGQQEPDLPLM